MFNPEEKLVNFSFLKDEDIFTQLVTSSTGLSGTEAQKRLLKFGRNTLEQERKFLFLFEFLRNFRNPLVIILIFASIVSFFLGETINAFIILSIILLSLVLSFVQEHQASKAAEKLKDRVATKATVLRDREQQEIKLDFLVVGDIVLLSSGDLVPADCKVIESDDFFVNQSSLTGESFPRAKVVENQASRLDTVGEIPNIVYFGTNVVSGSATAVVLKTGLNTEFGKIAKDITDEQEESDFTRGVKEFSLLILKVAVFFVLFVFFFISVFKHNPVFQSFTFALAIAVGLTPELLPIIMSITMARGSARMAKKGAIVKKLSSIPNFGSMDILCTDKTGTLTQDKIELIKYTDISGKDSEEVLINTYLNSFYQRGIKNPMDEAVLNYKKIGEHGFNKLDEIPFDFVRKMISVVVEKEKEKEKWLVTKGAPEEVIKASLFYLDGRKSAKLDEKAKEKLLGQYQQLSRDGYRVLAVAKKKLPREQEVYSKSDETSLEVLGFVSFLDPAKEGVTQVLKELTTLGIEIKVITGDNELVTQKICHEVGLAVKGVLLGSEIDSLTDDALKVVVEKTTIFARFSPDEKNRIISALKGNNHVVGYLGDGINDAPSLKTADVGISVDNAVDIAKDSASIILTQKSLHDLKEGVIEGRKTFGNTMKYVMMGISSNFGNMFSVLGAVLFIPFLPMLPIQILLNNLLYDFSQVTIPTDSVDQEFIKSPRKWNVKIIRNFMFVFGPISSIFDFLTFFIFYGVLKASAPTFQTAWFLESLATQTLVIYIIRTKRIPFLESWPSKLLLLSTVSVVALGWVLPYTSLGKLFKLIALPVPVLILIISITGLYLLTAEIAKKIFYKMFYI